MEGGVEWGGVREGGGGWREGWSEGWRVLEGGLE